MPGVTISRHKHSVLVTGDTKPIKEELRSLGGSWNKTLGGWVFRKRDHEKVVSKLRSMPQLNVNDRTAGAAAATTAAARSARPASASASADADGYSDLASLPTPNKGKFVNGAAPGEIRGGKSSVPRNILQYLISTEGGRIIASRVHGDVYEVSSRRQKQEQGPDSDDEVPAGGYIPKISVEDERHMSCKHTKNFVCDGTLYRHTAVSWEGAPVEFKRQHNVEATKAAPAESICYEHKIEDLTPFDCDVYWKTVWEKCKPCHEADQEFKRWAMRASTPGGMAAISKKRKADEAAAAAASSSAEEAEGQGEAKVRKGNLKSE